MIRNGGEVGQVNGRSEESSDTQSPAHSQTAAVAQKAAIEAQDHVPQEVTYKTVKKQRLRSATPNPFGKPEGGWEAAKAVMG